MMLKAILIASCIASHLMRVSLGECENACSGHGRCTVFDMCECYRNWQANDCSESKWVRNDNVDSLTFSHFLSTVFRSMRVFASFCRYTEGRFGFFRYGG